MLWFSKITDISESKFNESLNALKEKPGKGFMSVFKSQYQNPPQNVSKMSYKNDKKKLVVLPNATIQRITKFIFMPDRIRSLLSELLQRAMVSRYFMNDASPQSPLSKTNSHENKLNNKISNIKLSIKRTIVNKPYVYTEKEDNHSNHSNGTYTHDDHGNNNINGHISISRAVEVGTFNFNASHHGDYVAIISHPCLLVRLVCMIVLGTQLFICFV